MQAAEQVVNKGARALRGSQGSSSSSSSSSQPDSEDEPSAPKGLFGTQKKRVTLRA